MNPTQRKISRQQPWFDHTQAIPSGIRTVAELGFVLQVMLLFAAFIRDRRHHPDSILEKLLSFLFSFIPAERAMLFRVDEDGEPELFGSTDRRDPSAEVRLHPEILDRAMKEGDLASESMMCVRMRSFEKRLGYIYVDRSDAKEPFESKHFDQLMAVATVAGVTIDHANDVARLRRENEQLLQNLNDRYPLIGESPAMAQLKVLIGQAAPSDASILIQGETGAGKELVARAIHNRSRRAPYRYLAINCGAVPENLMESEFFGHEKGAFTGALAQKKGHFEAASGGTLFLDEIGELPLPLQARLLRVLQEKEILRLGSHIPVKVDVRVIAATNRDLAAAVAEGKFREDLYYRLNVISIPTPPLRERPQDILVLARHFMAKYSEDSGRLIRGLSPEVEQIFENHRWPGNVRELQNVIQRAVVLTRGDIIHVEDLSPELRKAQTKDNKGKQKGFDSAKLEAVQKALRETNGNVAKAAEMLDISPQYIYKLLRKRG